MSRALELVRWLLRRQGLTHGQFRARLVLLRSDPLLATADGEVQAAGATWQVRPVGGPLSLRQALRTGEHHVLVLAEGFSPPLDVSQRAWLRRPLMIEARDVVAAAAQRFCRELADPELMDRLRDDLEGFFQRAEGFSFKGPLVSADEAQQILVGQRSPLAHQPAERWLADLLATATPPASRHPIGPVVRAAYVAPVGDWLAYALGPAEDGSGRAALVSAGVLAGVPRLFEAFVADRADWPGGDLKALAALVGDAWRRAARQSPALADRWLAPAEALVTTEGLDWQTAARLPALRASLSAIEAHLFESMAAGQAGEADAWAAWIDHPRAAERSLLVEPLRALARFASDRWTPDALTDWVALSREVAVADRLAREARRAAADATGPAVEATRRVFDGYLARRDDLNAAFARTLASREARAYRTGEARDGLALHTVGSALVRPLLAAGHKVLLVVLDGCDQSTLLEVLDALPDMGPTRPPVLGSVMPTGWITALSPVPTLTSNGRRALFGGQIPGNRALTTEEAAAADSSGDKRAFAQHPAWRDHRSALLLKGDLGADEQGAIEALRGDLQLLAVVFNIIDDSLSSKGTQALGPWDAAHLGRGLRDTLAFALEREWVVLVTADHGHTPHWHEGRKVKVGRGRGQRYRESTAATLDGEGQCFGPQSWRENPLVALTRVGGYLSSQHVGYHGGAGLEEVTVPVVCVGRDRLPPPTAWFLTFDERPSATGIVVEPVSAPEPAPAAQPAPKPEHPSPAQAGSSPPVPPASGDAFDALPEPARGVYRYVARHGVITWAQLILQVGNARAARAFSRRVDDYNRDAPFSLRADGAGSGKQYEKVTSDG